MEFKFCRILFQISKEYENEIILIQRDIQKFREENEAFKQKLQQMFHTDETEESSRSSPQLRNDYIFFTDEIFNNFRHQLQLLCQVSSEVSILSSGSGVWRYLKVTNYGN